jgi:hypothetical protein
VQNNYVPSAAMHLDGAVAPIFVALLVGLVINVVSDPFEFILSRVERNPAWQENHLYFPAGLSF